MKKVYAVWEGARTRTYITPGKKYEASEINSYSFSMVCDDGDKIACCWNNSIFLDGGNWTCIEEDDEAPQPEQKTLRDEFAMAALTGVLASDVRDSRENFAAKCYKMADAMLEARKK